jgi:hypothetical protein
MAIGARQPGWRVNAPAPGGLARADFRRRSKIGGDVCKPWRADPTDLRQRSG